MYDHKKMKEEIEEYWKQNKIIEKHRDMAKNGEKYYFLDGPPYVTGEIHPGSAWNKCMKDAFLRYLRMRGYHVRDTPGFDTHGLPIEVKVEQKLGFKNKQDIERFGIENFIKECKDFADKYREIMTGQFKSFSVWMDWDNPYITYKNDYIEKNWATIKAAHEKGLLYEGEQVVPYCYRCQTTLANYELEYWDETDPSIYVKFKLKGTENTYLIIWTTTPWTLPGNMAVAVHPDINYVELEVDGERWILAKSKAEEVLGKSGKEGKKLREFKGKELEGKEYEHPLQDLVQKEAERKVVVSEELVSEDSGTGLVHIAPGHGPEDFKLGKEKGIEAFSPVDTTGSFTSAFKGYEGKNVKEANPEIIEELKNRGSLVIDERIVHRYAHCWRCKTALIYLLTKQWFLGINKVKEKMLEEVETANWVPDIARSRFKTLLDSAPDWNISRQRFWGIPLPIWRCKECEKVKVIGSSEELGKKLEDLHRPYIDEVVFDCECGGSMYRVPDVLDVWFDSGNAVWASQDGSWGEKAELIIEGHDQIRGWFYSLLGCGVAYSGAIPYKTVVMHGFFVDEKGEKMSKSLGNFVSVDEILERYGGDAFRLFGLSVNLWEDVRFNWDGLKEAKADLGILLNLVEFLKRHVENKPMPNVELEEEDRWMLSKLNSATKEYHKAMSEKLLAKAVREVRKILVDTLSKKYMKIAKSRIAEGRNKEAALFVIYESVLKIASLLAPITPITSEKAYISFFKEHEGKESIHTIAIEDEKAELIDHELEKVGDAAFELISEILNLRNEAGVKLRWPLQKAIILSRDSDYSLALKKFGGLIMKLTNIKEIINEEVKGDIVWNDEKTIGLDKNITQELWEEGIANDIARRIQTVRKKRGLKEKNIVPIHVGGDGELIAIVKKYEDYIKARTHASEIGYNASEEDESFMVDGRPLYIRV